MLKIALSGFLLFCTLIGYTQETYDFTGRWNTPNGDMLLVQNGDSVYGYYDYNYGEVYNGFVTGNTLQASFVEDNGNSDELLRYDRGWFKLTLSNNRMSFGGTKTYGAMPDTPVDFTGSRKKGVVSGHVYDDETDDPMSNVRVVLMSPDQSEMHHETTTNNSGYYTFGSVYTGNYWAMPDKKFFNAYTYVDFIYGLMLIDTNIDDLDFWLYPNAFLTLSAEKKSLLYGEEVTIRLEIRDEDSVLIEGSHEVRFQENYENLGYFENDGIATTENGIAEIVYTAPDEEEAGAWEHLKIKATLTEFDYDDNYRILDMNLGTGMPVWAEPRHSKYIIDNSKTAIIPSHPNYPALLYGKCEDEKGEPVANQKLWFEIESESQGRLWNRQTEETGQKIAAWTNSEGIASVYYIYNEHERLKQKLEQKISITNKENSTYGMVTVEVGLGLRIDETERYRSSGGIITLYTPVDLVQYVSSDFHPDLDIHRYALSAQETVWDEMDVELGMWYELKWVNKPSSWWNVPDDETYAGRCRFDELDGETILKALDEPSDLVGNSHCLPQFIPYSKGNHLYFSSAWLTNNKMTFQTTSIPVAFSSRLFATNVDVDSKLTDVLCSVNPTSKQQVIIIFAAKKALGIYGNLVDFIGALCNFSKGENLKGLINLWAATGSTYIDYHSNKFKAFNAEHFKDWTWGDIKTLVKAAHAKDQLDYIKLFTHDLPYTKDWYTPMEWFPDKSGELKSVQATGEGPSAKEFIPIILSADIGLAQASGFSGSRNMTLFNGTGADIKREGESPREIELPFGEISDFMYAEDEKNAVCIFREGDEVDVNFDASEDCYLTIYNDGDSGFKMFDASDYPKASCKIKFDNSNNEILQIDTDRNGSYETTVQPIIMGNIGGGGGSNVRAVLNWYNSVGGSGRDYEEDIVIDDDGNTYLLARIEYSPAYTKRNIITYSSNADFFTVLIKFSPQGEMLWHKIFDGCYPYGGLSLGSDGNVYAGIYVVDDNFRVNNLSLQLKGGIIIKYDPDGNAGWANNCVRGEKAHLYDLEVDDSNNFYIAGRFDGTINTGDISLSTNAGNDDWYIAKFDQHRDLQWFKTGKSLGGEYVGGISLTEEGILFHGIFSNTLNIGNLTYYKSKTNERFFGLMDYNGNVQWVRFIQSDEEVSIVSMMEVEDEYHIYVRSPLSGNFWINNQLMPETEGYDMFCIQLDNQGNTQSVEMTIKEGNQFFRDLVDGEDKEVLVSGRYTGQVLGYTSTADPNYYHGFFARLNMEGTAVYFAPIEIPGHNTLDKIDYNPFSRTLVTVGDFYSGFILNGNSIETQGQEDILILSYTESIVSENRLVQAAPDEDLFRLYPNPTRNSFTVEYNKLHSKSLTISLWDIYGNKISVLKHSSERPYGNAMNFSSQGLKNGIYFIVLETPGKKTVKKLMVTK